MPDAKTHAIAGFVAGITACSIVASREQRSPGCGELLSAGLIGSMAALLPDQLEPASHPHHRAFFHSIIVGAALLKLGHEVLRNSARSDGMTIPVSVALSGYLSHLVLDFRTTRGLPFSGL